MGDDILKIGLVTVSEGAVLVVRKRGGSTFILPGGKPEGDETELVALGRELREELGCGLAGDPVRLGAYRAPAADLPGRTVTVVAYAGGLVGEPTPLEEIEELAWHRYGRDDPRRLAGSIRRMILPDVARRGLLGPLAATKVGQRHGRGDGAPPFDEAVWALATGGVAGLDLDCPQLWLAAREGDLTAAEVLDVVVAEGRREVTGGATDEVRVVTDPTWRDLLAVAAEDHRRAMAAAPFDEPRWVEHFELGAGGRLDVVLAS